MTISAAIMFFAIAAALTTLGVWIFLRIQPRLGLLDVPNERSSHSKPIPRGSGLVILAVALLLYVAVSEQPSAAFLISALMIAVVSFIDDMRSTPLLARLLVHILAATLIVYKTGGYEMPRIPGIESGLQLDVLTGMTSVLFIVGMINAYNFMDGIDGILGAQGISAGIGFATFGYVIASPAIMALGTILAGCCLGFLFFNWHPARVFSGDTGSTFLGFAFAVIPLLDHGQAEMHDNTLFYPILFSFFFIFDTAYTRISLIVQRKPFWRPHREHLYQKLVRCGISHAKVSLFFGIASLMISILTNLTQTRPYAALAASVVGGALLFAAHKNCIDLKHAGC